MHEVDEALATARRTGEVFALGEVQRLRGEILVARRDRVLAAECFHAALATARAQGARMLELRAATCYAQLLVNQRQHVHARQLLQPVCASFSDQPQTREINDARTLLAQLS